MQNGTTANDRKENARGETSQKEESRGRRARVRRRDSVRKPMQGKCLQQEGSKIISYHHFSQTGTAWSLCQQKIRHRRTVYKFLLSLVPSLRELSLHLFEKKAKKRTHYIFLLVCVRRHDPPASLECEGAAVCAPQHV